MFGLLSNYLLLSLRNIKRQRTHALINIFGLSIGLIVFILIFLFLVHEYSYDKSWRDHEQIYRLHASLDFNGREDHFALSSYNMAQAMKNDFPDIKAATMIFRTSFSNDQVGVTVYYDDKMYEIPSYTMADADFFNVFDYPFVEGDPNTALSEPKSLVISKKTAKNIFGDQAAFGQLIRIKTTTYKVTGVIDKEACQSHLLFDALISMSTMNQETIDQMKRDWFWLLGYTYIRFKDEALIEGFDKKLESLRQNTIKPWIQQVNVDGDIKMAIEPVSSIHFNNHLQYDSASNTNKRFVKMFAYIAVFLLLIASINYMNLATARSIKRAREIGIRKVSGAQRSQLIIQFLGESIFTAFLAFVLALLVTELLLPWFNTLVGMELSLAAIYSANNIHNGLLLLLVVLLLGLISGSFPAFVLSSFSPMDVLRSGSFSGKKQLFSASNLRKALVVFQFLISISLIISTLIVSDQLQFMRKYDSGIALDQVMVIHFPSDTTLYNNKEVLRQELLKLPEVKQVSLTESLPGYQSGRLMFFLGDTAKPEVRTMNLYVVDHDFFDLLEIKTLEGRTFSKEYPNDSKTAFVVNKAAAEFLGYDNPVGVDMYCGMDVEGKIIGMVNDFHYSSLHNPIEPLVLILSRDKPDYVAVKIKGPFSRQAIDHIAEIWQNFDQKHFFNYHFLDQQYARQYQREEKMLSLFGYFSFIVVLISCLGLYGLSAFTIEQRTKEIGIRKILGSSTWHLIKLTIFGFMKLVLLAGIIAIPLTYFLMQEWMNDFAYRVGLHPAWFALGILAAIVVALVTVYSQAIKAVNKNPVDAIKYE
ncbi:MAG: ABC transporter permease [Bacteroidetes bacterium]|jgi:putative ABC transport system permease protein|nr:ABC transporter permease [Bacteroidota bacterium]